MQLLLSFLSFGLFGEITFVGYDIIFTSAYREVNGKPKNGRCPKSYLQERERGRFLLKYLNDYTPICVID